MKTLVVYYSRKGYTEKIALAKAKEENADFLCIEPLDSTVGYDGFMNCVKKSVGGAEMHLFPYDTDIASYDKVIICSPVWFSKLSLPMTEFIKKERHNISRAEYVLVHLLESSVARIVNEMDNILRLKHEKYTSIQCVWGKIKKEEEISNV